MALFWGQTNSLGAETINIAGANGSSGSEGANSGDSGINGEAGESVTGTAENAEDGSGGSIVVALTLTGGNGGYRSGDSQAGKGADVTVASNVVRATSQGGPISLSITGNGGQKGCNNDGSDGLGGDVRLIDTLAAHTSTIASHIGLIQTAIGGEGGGQALSALKHESLTAGVLKVVARAIGGTNASFDPPGQAFDSALGLAKATSIARGALISPVAEMSAYCFGENFVATGQDAPTHAAAAAASGFGIGLLTGSFGFGGSHTMAVIDSDPATVFSFGSLITNPDVANFFAGLPQETHLITCRPVQRGGAVDFDGGRVVSRRYGGTFQLAPCLSGGQLVFSGLGHKSAGGALDGMAFTVRRDDTALLETSDPALFTNTVTVLDDLAQANANSSYRWEIITSATSAEQTFEAYFAFSATAPVGLGSTQGAGTPLSMGPIRMTLPTDPAASPTLRLISGTVTGGVPLTSLLLESTSDRGLVERWRPGRTFTFDASGNLTFEETVDLADPSAFAA